MGRIAQIFSNGVPMVSKRCLVNHSLWCKDRLASLNEHRTYLRVMRNLFVLCALVVGACLYPSLRNDDLVHKSRKVVAAPRPPSLRLGNPFQYRWASDHELVVIHGEGYNNKLHIFLKDTQTGKVTVLPRLSRLLTNCAGGISQMEISPDRKALFAGFTF